MYAGHVVESGPSEDVLAHPKHPYTQLLLSAVPDPRAPVNTMPSADVGEPPRVVDPSEGCRFRGRCPYAIEVCFQVTPHFFSKSCWFRSQIAWYSLLDNLRNETCPK